MVTEIKKRKKILLFKYTYITKDYTCIKKVNQSHYRPEVLRGFQEVKVHILRVSGPGWW